MFHQVLIYASDVLSVLWCYDDKTREANTFVKQVITFEGNYSSCSVNFVKILTAENL